MLFEANDGFALGDHGTLEHMRRIVSREPPQVPATSVPVTNCNDSGAGSPAIDAGNDVSNFAFDQRGTGFIRIIGAGADIGAFELDTSDELFADGFDP